MQAYRSRQSRLRHFTAACMASALLALLLVAPATATAAGIEPPGWDLTTIAEPTDYPELALDAGRAAFGPQEERSPTAQISLYDLATRQLRTVTTGAVGYGAGKWLEGDHLTYVQGIGQAAEVYLLTVSTGESLRITDNQVRDHNPRIAGDLVVWGEDQPEDFTSRAWLYRISSGERVLLDSGEGFVYPSQFLLSEGWVVWRRYESREGSTWAYSVANGEKRELAQIGGNLSESHLEYLAGNVLYYVKRTDTGHALHSLDLSTGQDRVIRGGVNELQSVRASEGRLAWASYDAGGSYVAIFEVATGQETRVYTPAYTVGGLVFADDLIVWRGDGRTTTYRVPTSYLFAYEGSSRQLTRLTSSQLYASRWETDGESILFSSTPWATGRYPVVVAQAAPLAGGFMDIFGTYPYRTAVLGLQEEGVVGGYPRAGGESEFRPNAPLYRAQFAKMLAEGFDVPVSEELVAPFTDLGADRSDLYPHEYVAALTSLGIVKGTSAQHFSPWASVSRAQLATFAVRTVQTLREPGLLVPGEPWMTSTLGNFDPTHGPAMTLAERNGLLDGLVGFGKNWDPWAPATRAEAAQVLWNAMTIRE